jgi:hypothetical protein
LQKEKAGHTSDYASSKKKPPFMTRLREWLKRETTFTNSTIAFFTALIFGIGVMQARLISGQLDDMRKDQRPWIKVTVDHDILIQPSAGVATHLHLINSGKTPAKNTVTDAKIDIVKNGEQPKIRINRPYNEIISALVFPNDPADFPVYMSGSMSQPEYDDFTARRNFLIIYARVSYTDFFGIRHWTQFCQAVTTENAPATAPGTTTSQSCTEYNDVDEN